ncbi:hypothetical protein CB1_000182011 [Camelus ferus]|nr:hypothetical protein CB1_000182011 [Camelus ferus]
MVALTEANEMLKKQIEELQQEATKAITEQKQRMKRLGSDLSSAQKEMKTKHKAYENAVGILSRRLQEALVGREAAEAELHQLRARAADGGGDLALHGGSPLHERIQALEAELQTVAHSKTMLERELQEVIAMTGQELEEHREKVLELEDEVQAVLQRKEEEDRRVQQLVQALQAALQKERSTAHSLEEQCLKYWYPRHVGSRPGTYRVNAFSAVSEDRGVIVVLVTVAAAKAEAGHNRRHFRAATLELSEVKKELQAKEQAVRRLQAEADGLQIQEGKHSQEVAQFQAELAEARTQLQLLQKQLDEQLSREPVGTQEMENLKWEVDQKEREIQSLKQQLNLTEQQSKKELDGIQQSWQNIKAELEMVRGDLSMTQKDKFTLQAKVSELKNNMKTLLQQNQQLQLDLRRGAAKTRKERKGDASSSSPVTPVKVPDCPVPASLLEELLRPPPAVSKEPLKNLNSCLQQLKYDLLLGPGTESF